MRLASLIFAGLLVLATGCRRAETTAPTQDATLVKARLGTAAMVALPTVIEVPATVRPVERAVISAKLIGTVSALPWGLGQEVRAGELLVALSVPETEARLRQAQARLAEAERAVDRERNLVDKGVNAPESLRDAVERLTYAQAGLAEAESMLAHASIRAPFAGVVTEKHVLPGDLATPGLPLLTLESSIRLRAEGTVPEQALTSIRIGGPIGVVLDGNTIPVLGTVEELSSATDSVSRSAMVKVSLPTGTARSGQFARLRLVVGQSDSILVPANAVTRFGQMERVFVVRDGRAVLRLVKTGRDSEGQVEILSGLQPGETVILSPPASLREGARVTGTP